MLEEMRRDAAVCGDEVDEDDSGIHNSTLLKSQLRFGEDPPSDSSDEDTSTFKSPVSISHSCINCHKSDCLIHVFMSF